ncbi:hypothetical protein OsI_30477 [Oryza sativa Indica Group]|uniref:Uncharacterized protein n=1 Tax=Oryza sativa subsp. indica TaxID=39946 RepID=A2YYQ9_ORYSI|nr:hypothetical protein OsI_30477 [Oryza sativa Indica Group]
MTIAPIATSSYQTIHGHCIHIKPYKAAWRQGRAGLGRRGDGARWPGATGRPAAAVDFGGGDDVGWGRCRLRAPRMAMGKGTAASASDGEEPCLWRRLGMTSALALRMRVGKTSAPAAADGGGEDVGSDGGSGGKRRRKGKTLAPAAA